MRTESPLAGRPKTTRLWGKPGFRVVARYLTPTQAKFIDVAVQVILWVAGFWIVGTVAEERTLLAGLTIAFLFWAIPWCLLWQFGFFYWFGREFFGTRRVLEFTPEAIRVSGLFGFKNYDRRWQHEFDCTTHEKAQEEEEEEVFERQMAALKGKKQKKIVRPKKYYRNSYQIVLRYAGQRVDIASVFGRKDAETILTRLQVLDAELDSLLAQTSRPGVPGRDQYGRRPDAG